MDEMPTYGLGSNLWLVVGEIEVDVEVASTRVEEGVVVVVADVVAPNPSLDRKCQFHSMGSVRSRTTRIFAQRGEVKEQVGTKHMVPTVRASEGRCSQSAYAGGRDGVRESAIGQCF